MDGGRPYTSASHINVPPDAVGKNINGVINNALRVKKKKKNHLSPFPCLNLRVLEARFFFWRIEARREGGEKVERENNSKNDEAKKKNREGRGRVL